MKVNSIFRLVAASATVVFFVVGCNSPKSDTAASTVEATQQADAKPDMAAMKAEIQALEDAWEVADNTRNVDAITSFYADDAQSIELYKPDMLVGKAAIRKSIEESLSQKPKGQTNTFETLEVFGNGNILTEIGKTTTKDASGKVISTNKYMAIWEKRNGKFVTIRDIYSADAKPKI